MRNKNIPLLLHLSAPCLSSIPPSCLHPELSGCITTLSVRNTFCAAMDTLIDQDELPSVHPQHVRQVVGTLLRAVSDRGIVQW